MSNKKIYIEIVSSVLSWGGFGMPGTAYKASTDIKDHAHIFRGY